MRVQPTKIARRVRHCPHRFAEGAEAAVAAVVKIKEAGVDVRYWVECYRTERGQGTYDRCTCAAAETIKRKDVAARCCAVVTQERAAEVARLGPSLPL